MQRAVMTPIALIALLAPGLIAVGCGASDSASTEPGPSPTETTPVRQAAGENVPVECPKAYGDTRDTYLEITNNRGDDTEIIFPVAADYSCADWSDRDNPTALNDWRLLPGTTKVLKLTRTGSAPARFTVNFGLGDPIRFEVGANGMTKMAGDRGPYGCPNQVDQWGRLDRRGQPAFRAVARVRTSCSGTVTISSP